MAKVSLALELNHEEAWLLAQYLKRVTYSDVRSNAQDDDEARAMLAVTEKVRQALQSAGYAPR